MDFRNPFGSSSGALSKIWAEAKGKYSKKTLDTLDFSGGFSPDLDALEDAIAQLAKLRTKTIPELKERLLKTCRDYRVNTEKGGFKDLTAALDTIREKVENV